MTLSRDSALALQRHYLGALSTPARTWLEPLPEARLALAGNALRVDREGPLVDFGTVASPGQEQRTVRVFCPGSGKLVIRSGDPPAWLQTDWAEGPAAAELVLRIVHDREGEYSGSLPLSACDGTNTHTESLRIRMVARRSHPAAEIDFNGSPVPRPFAFDTDGRPYELSVRNQTSVPLVVTFADLPDWLAIEVDGRRRGGPIAGRFFERTAPFIVRLRPQFLGQHHGVLRMQTNDPRPEVRNVELRFSACVAPLRPHIRALAPRPLAARTDQLIMTNIRLENWGRSPAHLACKAPPPSITVARIPPVAAARDGQPGTAVLPIGVAASLLSPGAHTISIPLQVQGGDPAEIQVPLQLQIAPAEPRKKPAVRPEMVAAVVALLLLTLLFIIAAKGLS